MDRTFFFVFKDVHIRRNAYISLKLIKNEWYII